MAFLGPISELRVSTTMLDGPTRTLYTGGLGATSGEVVNQAPIAMTDIESESRDEDKRSANSTGFG